MTWTPNQAKALAAVFDTLNQAGIPWLVLRNYQGLPDDNRSKDVDIAVHPRQFGRAERAIDARLRAMGYRRKQLCIMQWGRLISYYADLDGVPTSIKIDLMDGFSWRVAAIFGFEKLAPDMRDLGAIFAPGVVDDAVMLWVKPLMTGGFTKAAYVDRIREVFASHPDEFRRVLHRLFSANLAERAWSHLQAGDFDALLPMKRKLSWNAWWREIRSRPFASVWAASKYVLFELLRRSQRPPASFLAVLGPDGVGKTTFIEALRAGLAELQAKDLDDIIVQHFRPRVFPNIQALLRRGDGPVDGQTSVPHEAPPAGTLSSLVRITYYWLDYIWGYWARMRRQSVAGRTVVYDRYIYDFQVDPKRSRFGLPQWVIKRFVALAPKPDMVIFLDAEPEVIFARKQELQPPEIERQLLEYRALCAAQPDKFLRLDASLPPEENVKIALLAIIDRLYKPNGSIA